VRVRVCACVCGCMCVCVCNMMYTEMFNISFRLVAHRLSSLQHERTVKSVPLSYLVKL